MTLVRLIAHVRLYKHKFLNLVIMGGSAKVEERLYNKTNYYEELTNFYPEMKLKLFFVGPEQSVENHGKTIEKNPRLSAYFFRGKTSEYLETFMSDDEMYTTLAKKETLFIGFNPGFGSGYQALLESWAHDLVMLLNHRYPVFFTQANDFSDLKGETKVFETIFESKVKYIMAPEINPFRAMTHYQGEQGSE